jgi:hypothetical protein
LNPTGKVYTAANPMEFIGAGINRLRGETEQGRIEGERGKAMTGLGGKLDEAVQQAMDEQERERKRRQMMMMQQQGGAPVQSPNLGEF